MTADDGYVVLAHRAVVAVDGEDRATFLQGLVSNDVAALADARAIYAALLTPQGKFLHDLFVVADGPFFLLDCERERRHDLLRRLTLYRLRSKVGLHDRGDDLAVAAIFGAEVLSRLGLATAPSGHALPLDGGVLFRDPRHPDAGARALLPAATLAETLARLGLTPAPWEAFERHRIRLALPDGSRDLAVDKTLLLEAGFDVLNGIDWKKGCYVGQELTARTRYRGLVRRRLVPITVDGPALPAGTPVEAQGTDVGEVRSSVPGFALAMLRIEALTSAEPLSAVERPVRPLLPDGLAIAGNAD